jgi:mRNA interferase MazF
MGRRQRISYPRRGEVYLVSFDPTVGSEIRKTRPAVILQNDIGNRHSPLTIVAAVTSQFELPPYPTEVHVLTPDGGLAKDSVVLLNQMRSIDRRRLVQRLGVLSGDTMRRVDAALSISVGLVDM